MILVGHGLTMPQGDRKDRAYHTRESNIEIRLILILWLLAHLK